eukprot:Clim_evm10s87 gene=Clim_evmTU10s87
MVSSPSIAAADLAALPASSDDQCEGYVKISVKTVSCYLPAEWTDNMELGGVLPPTAAVSFNALNAEYYMLPAGSKPFGSEHITWTQLDAFNPGWYVLPGQTYEFGMYLFTNTASGKNSNAIAQTTNFTAPLSGGQEQVVDYTGDIDTIGGHCQLFLHFECRDEDTDPIVPYLTDAVTISYPGS